MVLVGCPKRGAALGLLIALIVFFTSTLAARTKQQALEGQVEVLTAKPNAGPGVVQKYSEEASCSPGLANDIDGVSKEYAVDTCFNINPHMVKEIKISTPAICPNGTRAIFGVYASSSCWGNSYVMTHVTDEILGQCADASRLWSFAFVCEGVAPSWFSPAALLSAVLGLVVFAFGLGTTAVFCGGCVVFVGGFGLIVWAVWMLFKSFLGLFKTKPRANGESETKKK